MTTRELNAVRNARATGYPCNWCWISRGNAADLAAHLRFWHEVQP